MKLNSIKRLLRRALPEPIFDSIQRIRRIGHHTSDEVESLRAAFESLQIKGGAPESIRLRAGIDLRIDPESWDPFTWFCWRSPEMVKELDFFIERVRGMQSFADVGANHGIFSLVFLRLNPAGQALSIDPSPLADQIRQKNRTLNAMDSSLISYKVACGAAEGTVNMHFNWHHLEVSGKGDEGLESVLVRVRPLDAVCKETRICPEVVKIDVEGFELQVLQGSETTLQSARLLLLEVHPDLLDKLCIAQRDIFDWLDRRGWRIQTLAGNKMTRADFCDRIHTFWTVCEHQVPPPASGSYG